MANANLVYTLGKVIIAAAWADGDVGHDEINSLKDLLFRLPDLTANDWARLDMYIESPVDEAERARLVAELQGAIKTSADRRLALDALDALVSADGQITEDEERVAAEIRAAVEAADVGIVGGLTRLIRGPVQRRVEAVAGAPNREVYFEDFIKNKVYYAVRRRLDRGEGDPGIPEARLRKLSLAGGLLARVAYADAVVTDDESDAIARALENEWGITHEEAVFVAEVAVSEASRELDYHRLTRGFYTATESEAERLRFLDALFAVAAADGMASLDEIEEIRAIARSLKLLHGQFIAAKLKIPRERRAG